MYMTRLLNCLLMFAVSPCFAAEEKPSEAIKLTFDPTPRQEIKGWGVYPGYFHKRIWGPRSQVQDRADVMALHAQMPYTILRTEIRSEYWKAATNGPNDKIADLVEGIRAVRKSKPNLPYIVSIWSPPADMKMPPIAVGVAKGIPGIKDGTKSKLQESREADFCDFVVNCLKHLETEGVGLPMALSIQNEPGHAVWYESTAYDRDKPEQYFRVNILMRKKLDEAGMQQVELHGPDINDYNAALWMLGRDNLFEKLTSNSEMMKAWGSLCTHTYEFWHKNPTDRLKYIKEYSKAAQNWQKLKGGADLWMTEFSIDTKIAGVETENDKGIFELRSLIRDFIMVPNNYWFYWHTPGIEINYKEDKVEVLPRYEIYKQFWTAAKPGSRVHEIKSSDPRLKGNDKEYLDLMGFRSAEGGGALLINPQTEPLEVALDSLDFEGKASLFQAVESGANSKNVSVAGGKILLTLPPRSISILNWKK